MTDLDMAGLVGGWRLLSVRRDGVEAFTDLEYRVFEIGGVTKEIWAHSFVDELVIRSTYSVLENQPRKLRILTTWSSPTTHEVLRERTTWSLFDVAGESLRLTTPRDEVPADFDSNGVSVETLSRVDPALLEVVKPPIRPPQVHRIEELGDVTWDVNANAWRGWLRTRRDAAQFYLYGQEGVLPQAEQIETLIKIRDRLSAYGAYAGTELVDLYNQTWRQGPGVLPADVLGNSLSAATVELLPDKTGCVCFLDGGNFGGHSVVVRLDSDQGPISAYI